MSTIVSDFLTVFLNFINSMFVGTYTTNLPGISGRKFKSVCKPNWMNC